MLNRRTVLSGLMTGLVAATGWSVPALAINAQRRALHVRNIHTGERLDLVYWANGKYLDKSLTAYDHLLRDHHLHRVMAIHPKVYDLLWIVQVALHPKGAIEILSGYRSAATNRMLAYATDGVAQHSYHIQGKAVDISIPGARPDIVAAAAQAVRFGGVGRYRGFVHLDTGPPASGPSDGA